MEKFQSLENCPDWLLAVIIVLIIWDAVWKITAMWKSARNNHLIWFICIAVFNTVGVLPLVYILLQRKKRAT